MPDETTPPNETRPRRSSSFRPADARAEANAVEKTDEEKAAEGHPAADAQIKLAGVAGPGTLRLAIDGLPHIPALDGIKANLDHYAPGELIEALEGLPLPEENKGAIESRDEIVRRIKAGELRR